MTSRCKRAVVLWIEYHEERGPVRKISIVDQRLHETPEQVLEFVKDHPHAKIISTANDWKEVQYEGFKVIFRSKDLFESPESVIVTPLYGGSR